MKASALADSLALEFVQFAVQAGVLKFGQFKTKAGRLSPYFFNAGLFNDGAKLGQLAQFYVRRLTASGLQFDTLFGPAYKGIILAASVAVELSMQGARVPYAYNRKEAKDHGEGGSLVGAPLTGLAGRVLIIDDVISAGTSVRESVDLIQAAGATPVGVLIALDRQETPGIAPNSDQNLRSNEPVQSLSAVQFVQQTLRLQVCAIAGLADLMHYLEQSSDPELRSHRSAVAAYREQYGVAH
jgi:orotate phosphoribosyltransferase